MVQRSIHFSTGLPTMTSTTVRGDALRRNFRLMRSWHGACNGNVNGACRARKFTSSCTQGSKDAVVGSWIDLTGFVATSKGINARTPYDTLAEEIGRECYIDVCGWHLYLKDIKIPSSGQSISMAQGLAQHLGPQIQGKGIRASDLNALLDKVPVTLGQGKKVVSLSVAMPDRCQQDLLDICENCSRNL
jgi:hypothetical protein